MPRSGEGTSHTQASLGTWIRVNGSLSLLTAGYSTVSYLQLFCPQEKKEQVIDLFTKFPKCTLMSNHILVSLGHGNVLKGISLIPGMRYGAKFGGWDGLYML